MPKSRETNERMRAESRAQILAAARRLFAEKGYFNARMADIARAAFMSQGNLYWYFPTKDDLLKAVLVEGYGAVGAMLDEVAALPLSGREKIGALVDRTLLLYRGQQAFENVTLTMLGNGGASFLAELGFDPAAIQAEQHRKLETILRQAQEEGAALGGDPGPLALFFLAFFNGLMLADNPGWLDLPDSVLRAAALRLLIRPAEDTRAHWKGSGR